MKKILLTVMILALFFLSACGEDPDYDADFDTEPEVAGETFYAEDPEEAESGEEDPEFSEGEPLERFEAQPFTEANPAADLGFRPDVNGFAFENYGDESDAENLTAAELQRMFGDKVCAHQKDGKCALTPPAAQWMKQINKIMSGGHCEGMAVLSLLMYSGQVQENQYGGEDAADLPFENDLQREIAYWWATQTVAPTVNSVIQGTPAEILETLLTMTPGEETYTIGIYKRDGSDGHAITPFAVVERGEGLYTVMVYDNNYPGQSRELFIDTHADTWGYEASINPQVEPELYEGDADSMTLDLTPTSARLGRQVCPFCEGSESGQIGKGRGVAANAIRYNEIFLEGDGHLMMVDDQDRYLGYRDGKFVNEIPGARMIHMRTAPSKDNPEPIYWLPQGTNTTIQLDGSGLSAKSETDLVLVGPGYTFGVEGIQLEANQENTVYFAPEEGWLTYETDQSQSPNIVIGIEEPAADFYFEIQGANMQGGGAINVMVDPKGRDLIINAEKLTNEGTFNLILVRIDDALEQEFYADDLVLKAGSILYINYADWEGDGSGLVVGVDLDGDGEIDETYAAGDE